MSKRTICKFLAFTTLLLVCGSAFADCSNLQAGGVFDNVVTRFNSETNTWLTNAETFAKDIFYGLAGIEFAWSAITWVLKKNSMGEYVTSLFFKMMSLAFFFWLISTAPTWIPMLLDGFQTMAAGITGNSTIPLVTKGMISPSAVMNNGVCVIGTIISAKWASSGLANTFLFAIICGASIIVIAIAYFVIVLQLVLTEIEAFIVLFGGLVMLGFTGSRWTTGWGEKYFGYAISVGVKLMVIYLIISLGNSVILAEIIKVISGANDSEVGTLQIYQFVEIMIETLIYAGLAWNIPSLAGSFLNGSPNMSMGNMAGPAMAAAGAVAGVAAVTAGAAAGAAGAAGKALGAAGGGGSKGADALAAMGQKAQDLKPKPSERSLAMMKSGGSSGGASSGGGSSGSGDSGGSSDSGASGGGDSGGSSSGGSSSSDSGSGSSSNGGQNAFNDPNAGNSNSGSSNTGEANKPKGKLQKATEKVNQFGMNRWQKALQKLEANDGSVGSATGHSIKHTD